MYVRVRLNALRVVLGLALATAWLTGLTVSAVGAAPPDQPPASAGASAIPGRYIVTLKPGVEPRGKANGLARAQGIGLRHVYESSLNGFAAALPDAALARLKADPDVLSIVEDRTIRAFADMIPTGLKRIEADRNATASIGSDTNPVAIDVAVIDTGIDPNHPDLNVVGGVSCVPGDPSYADANGHGTHVAGTIGALDNGSGVVGVAPGARLWAVRVLDAQGEGSFSDVICGINWVTAHAATIEVANMSLGAKWPDAGCADGGLHQAVCASVAAGVTYVAASGNDGANASDYVPAAFDEVITVSAIVDTDGSPGGRGIFSFYGPDDSLASFSNDGPVIDLAAPGVNVYSTWPGGGYNYSTGTSMASPHVAGAAALYLFQNPGVSPQAVKAALTEIAWEQGSPSGFTGDSDGFAERLLNAGAVGGDPLPPPTPSCALSRTSGPVGTSVTVSCANFPPSQSLKVYWDSSATTALRTFTTVSTGEAVTTFAVPTTPGGDHTVVVKNTSDPAGTEYGLPFTVEASLRLSTSTGKIGTIVTAYLKGFGAGEPVNLLWAGEGGGGTTLKSGTTAANGTVNLSLNVPEAARGDYTVTALGQASDLSASAPYSVIPSLKLSPTSGRVGATTTVTLQGYGAGEAITVNWYEAFGTSAPMATAIASGLGTASATVVVPEATRGSHSVEGRGASGSVASANFTVTTGLSLSATSGTVGSPVDLTLRGFAASEPISIRWYDTTSSATTVATLTASPTGSLDYTLVVPEATKGGHKIAATGATSGATASATFTVNASIALSPASGPAGTTVSVDLDGYRAGETVNVKWYKTATSSVVVATTTASASGSGTVTFVVPASAKGAYKVEGVSASLAKASATFTVE